MNARARWVGGLCLLLLPFAVFGMMVVPSRIVVPGDAAATAANLAALADLFRLGLVSDVVVVLIEVAVVTLLYLLFKPVDAALALATALARLTMTAIQGANVATHIAALLCVSRSDYLSDVPLSQLHAMASLFLNVHADAVHVWEMVFALHCLLLALLIWRSGYVPKLFGPLMAAAGLGYLANGAGSLLLPASGAVLEPIVAATAFLGELPFFVWLLVKGVKAPEPR